MDDEDIASLVARALFNKQSEGYEKLHKIIVIDEVDQFTSHEKAFTSLIRAVLQGTK